MYDALTFLFCIPYILATCPIAVEPNSGICFWLEDGSNRKTYSESSDACQNAGGIIAIVDTPEKKSHIFSEIDLSSKLVLYINMRNLNNPQPNIMKYGNRICYTNAGTK